MENQALRSSSEKNIEQLITELIELQALRSPNIIEAFHAIDRQRFVLPDMRDRAYENIPLPIGLGQTISQPLTVAIMLEAVQPKTGERVFDIGAGSGWVTALVGHLVGPTGRVIGIERVPELYRRALQTLRPLSMPQVRIIQGDGSRGWLSDAPYDVIHVAAAADKIHETWRQQLAIGGRLVVPVGTAVQDLAILTKIGDNTFSERRIPGFQFVPLITTA